MAPQAHYPPVEVLAMGDLSSPSVSHTGKEGQGIWLGVTWIYAWNAGVLNYQIIITFYRKYYFAVLEGCW